MGNVAPSKTCQSLSANRSSEPGKTIKPVSQSSITSTTPSIPSESDSKHEIQVNFRGIYRIIAQGRHDEKACALIRKLIVETRDGGGFLLATQFEENKLRLELQILQTCLFSENFELRRLACETYVVLEPNPERFNLMYGLTPEHIKWANENKDDIDAKRILALDVLSVPSIVEDIRVLSLTEGSISTRLMALKAMATLLLHPANRTVDMLNEKDFRLLRNRIVRTPRRSSVQTERVNDQTDLQHAYWKLLESWALSFSKEVAHDTPTLPRYSHELVFNLLDILDPEIDFGYLDEKCALSILKILYFLCYDLERSHIERMKRSLPRIASRYLRSNHRKLGIQLRYFSAMLLLTLGKMEIEERRRNKSVQVPGYERADAEVIESELLDFVDLQRKSMERHHEKKVATHVKPHIITPDQLALSLLLACRVRFKPYDAILHYNLTGMVDMDIDEAFGHFWIRLLCTQFRDICTIYFSVFSSRLLSIPVSVAFCFKIGFSLENANVFTLISSTLARPNSRDFAAQAFEQGVALFFQNSMCEFMYSTDKTKRKLSAQCSKYLVACFASHDLGPAHNLALYQFLLARLNELEGIDATLDPTIVESTQRDSYLETYLYLCRMGVCLTYRRADSDYERGPFRVVRSCESEIESENEDASIISAQAMVENPWISVEAQRQFLARLSEDCFQSNDGVLKFACERAISALVSFDEFAKLAILNKNTCILERFTASTQLSTEEELTMLHDLVRNPGGCTIWLCLDRPANALSNRAGGHPPTVVGTDSGTGSNVFTMGKKVLLQPSSLPQQSSFFVGARLVHVKHGPGLITQESERDDARFHISFDQGTNIWLSEEQLITHARLVGINEPPDSMSEWTIVFRIGSNAAEQEEGHQLRPVRVLCQGISGDVHVGIVENNLGCYDAENKRWYASTLSVQEDKSQTLVVIGRDNRTSFYLVDNAGSTIGFGSCEFQSTDQIVSIGNGVNGENPIGVLQEFMLFPFTWKSQDFLTRFSDSWEPEFPRIHVANFDNGAILQSLREGIIGDKSSALRRRLCAQILTNLALCPQSHLQVLHTVGMSIESLLTAEFTTITRAEGEPNECDEPMQQRSMLDNDVRYQLLIALL